MIIDAAEDVVVEGGARYLTLDAVAAKAGVSKGGLLYHFPSKEMLLQAMIDRYIEEDRKKRSAFSAGSSYEVIRAYILSTLDDRAKKLSIALLAAVAHNPHFLAPYQREYASMIEEFCQEGLCFEKAAVAMLAADGLKLIEILSGDPFNTEDRNRIIEEIISLLKTKGREG